MAFPISAIVGLVGGQSRFALLCTPESAPFSFSVDVDTVYPTAAKVSDTDKEALFKQFQAWEVQNNGSRAQARSDKK
ncbi:hypothetical protein [Bradyrhizobium sp. UFLA05-112]